MMNIDQITHPKAQVQKVIPGAKSALVVHHKVTGETYSHVNYVVGPHMVFLSVSYISEDDAWELAYQNLLLGKVHSVINIATGETL
jgi:hypothetical protein